MPPEKREPAPPGTRGVRCPWCWMPRTGRAATNQRVLPALSPNYPKSKRLSPTTCGLHCPSRHRNHLFPGSQQEPPLWSPFFPRPRKSIFHKQPEECFLKTNQIMPLFLVSALWKIPITFIMTSVTLIWPKTPYTICSCWPLRLASGHPPSHSRSSFCLGWSSMSANGSVWEGPPSIWVIFYHVTQCYDIHGTYN